MNAHYEPRLIDAKVQELLGLTGGLLIEGPRFSGKTETALFHSASHVYMDTPEAQALWEFSTQSVVEGEAPRLIDEWQVQPEVWNVARHEIDRRRAPGQFILTGSSVPDDDATRHTGAGRFLRLRQRTMTWVERGVSDGRVSLASLFDGQQPQVSTQAPELEEITHNLCVSGFPAYVGHTPQQARVVMDGYLEELVHTDVRRVYGARHQPTVLRALLASLARLTAAEASYATLAKDVGASHADIHPQTVSSYLEVLQRIFAVEAIEPWSGTLRSKATLRKSKKYQLADPALAVAALGATQGKLMDDLETTGLIFESAVIHDLLVMMEAMGGKVTHFRDSYGHEIDAVLELPDGRWAPIEVKLGGKAAAKAAQNLPRLAGYLDRPTPPAFMAVISGNGFTGTSESGVVTFPLSALGL